MEKINWSRFQPYIIEALLVILVVGIGWLSVGSLKGLVQAKMDRLQELDVLMENRYREMTSLPDLEKKYEFINENETKLSSVMLTKDNLVEFIQTLESLAETNHVDIKITSQDNVFLESKITVPVTTKKSGDTPAPDSGAASAAKKKPEGILADLPFSNYIRVSVTVTGLYPDAVSFLHAMETLPFALDVIGVTMSEHAGDTHFSTPDTGVNPFNPNGTLAPAPPVLQNQALRIDAQYDTVIYLKP